MIRIIFEDAKATVDLNFATIGSFLLAHSLLPTFELSGAKINWELCLASNNILTRNGTKGRNSYFAILKSELYTVHQMKMFGRRNWNLKVLPTAAWMDSNLKPKKISLIIENDLKSDSKPKKPIDWSDKFLSMQKSTIVLTKELIGCCKNSLIKQKNISRILSNKMGELKIDWSKFFEKKKDIAEDIAERDIEWFKWWLAKAESYSPQPFEQLATVLRNAGHKDKANKLLYESKRCERKTKKLLYFNWINLFLPWIFIGYADRYIFTFGWVFSLLVFGTKLCFNTTGGMEKGWV